LFYDLFALAENPVEFREKVGRRQCAYKFDQLLSSFIGCRLAEKEQ
jgi:hypothetical protein